MPGCFRRLLLLPGALALGASALPVSARERPPEIAITVDDLPVHGRLPAGETRIDIARKMIRTLRAAGLKHVYGFVNAGPAEADPGSAAALAAWRKAGFPLGNHTWSHPNLNALPAADYQAEIVRDEPVLRRLAGGTDWRWFRYPYLAEGDDPAKRAEVRHFLAGRRYRIAQVTMDFGDYAWNDPYARCMAKGDRASIAILENSYLDAARENARGFRTLAKALYGRDIPYVLLLHIGAFDARMLKRLIALYREEGFRFTTLPKAERDPAYAADVDPSLPPQPASLAARAVAKGIAVPPLYTRIAMLNDICR